MYSLYLYVYIYIYVGMDVTNSANHLFDFLPNGRNGFFAGHKEKYDTGKLTCCCKSDNNTNDNGKSSSSSDKEEKK